MRAAIVIPNSTNPPKPAPALSIDTIHHRPVEPGARSQHAANQNRKPATKGRLLIFNPASGTGIKPPPQSYSALQFNANRIKKRAETSRPRLFSECVLEAARNYFLLAVMFAGVRDESIFCLVLYLPGHLDQVIEAGKVGIVIDKRLRLLIL